MAAPGESAHVKSVEAIGAFRSAAVLYASKCRPLVEDAWDEVSRTREWLRNDRKTHWEGELRRRRRRLEDAEQALFSARFSPLKQVSAAEQAAVQRARRAVAEAESKLEKVRQWSLEFDDRTGPMLKQLEELRTSLHTDLPKAVVYLTNVIRALEAYNEGVPAAQAGPSPATEAVSVSPSEPGGTAVP